MKPQQKENWKPVVGYEGLYEVSDLGRLKSLPKIRWSERNQSFSSYKEIILKTFKDKKGYTKYSLHKNGKAKTHSTHKLVARAFIPNPKNKPTINHKNEIKDDNRASNLEWMTIGENVRYGKGVNKRSLNHKKKVVQLTEAGTFVRFWDSAMDAERYGGFNRFCISMCIRGKMKAHKYFIFKKHDKEKTYLTPELIKNINQTFKN